jgi:hypothetical protein
MTLNEYDYMKIFYNKIMPKIEDLGFKLHVETAAQSQFTLELRPGLEFLISVVAHYDVHDLYEFDVLLAIESGGVLYEEKAEHKKGATYLEEDDILEAVDKLIRFLTEN